MNEKDIEKVRAMQHGANAAAQVRQTGGLPAHLDALAQPQFTEVDGTKIWHQPAATFATRRIIAEWCEPFLEAMKDEDTQLPMELLLMQVYAFSEPRAAYMAARNGEGPYMAAAFDWADRELGEFPGGELKLGKLYGLVCLQCGILDAVNPPQPVPRNTGTAPAESPDQSKAEATPDSSPPSSNT